MNMKNIFNPNEISLVADYIRQGEVFAIPTETVYGLAADIRQDNAIKQIFSLKNRPNNHPLIIHISDISQLSDYAIDIPDYAYRLAKNFWPGPLTIVLRKSKLVSNIVTGGQDSVGIRMPNHELTLSLIKLVGSPLAAPSANQYGKISPTNAKHVITEFQGHVKVLDGGSCNIGLESTIIDATDAHTYSILRPGMISINAIYEVLDHTHITYLKKGTKAVSGSHKYHYAPSKPTFLFECPSQLKKISDLHQNSVYILSINDYQHLGFNGCRMPFDANKYAKVLYQKLRMADESLFEAIAIEKPPKIIEWEGILDRLMKSSAKSMEIFIQ
jgi:L-threonylcarbamoyladenylate synthase